jgi:hypothetical protein
VAEYQKTNLTIDHFECVFFLGVEMIKYSVSGSDKLLKFRIRSDPDPLHRFLPWLQNSDPYNTDPDHEALSTGTAFCITKVKFSVIILLSF